MLHAHPLFLLILTKALSLSRQDGESRFNQHELVSVPERDRREIMQYTGAEDVFVDSTESSPTDRCFNADGSAKEHYSFQKSDECINYYMCVDGNMYPAICPAGLAFHPESEYCLDPAEVPGCEYVKNLQACDETCLHGGYCIGDNECHCPQMFYGYRCLYVGYTLIPGLTGPFNTSWSTNMCTMYGTGHVITFDGLAYDFPGTCQYEMVSSVEMHDFKILVRRNPDCVSNGKYVYDSSPCIKEIKILIADASLRVIIQGTTVSLNEQSLSLPYDGFGLLVSWMKPYIVVRVGEMVLRWDEQSSAVYVILLNDRYINKTRGLCGIFDFDSANDLIAKSGELISGEQSSHLVAKSWKDLDIGESCIDTEILDEDNAECRNSEPVTLVCNILWSVFMDCHRYVDPAMYERMCREELCRCEYQKRADCHCNVLSQYARFCAIAEGEPPEWRTRNQCERKCESGLTWAECGVESPPTCAIPSTIFNQDCVDRCQCPAGLHEHGSRCVEKANCPCMHKKKEYKPGDRAEIYNCNNCTCNLGEWTCEASLCPGTAFIHGFSHFKTFDGRFFTFDGKCRYVFAKDVIDDSFMIIIENVECGADQGISCTKSFTVTLKSGGREQEVMFRHGGTVSINRFDVQLPYISGSLAIYRESSLSILMRDVATGLEVSWDGGGSIFITIPQTYAGKIRGLGGNYDGSGADDFITPQNINEETASSFGNSWKMSAQCEDVPIQNSLPCQINSQKLNYAEAKCGRMLSHVSFTRCHADVNPGPFYDNCLYDVCECVDEAEGDCLCKALAIYAKECGFNGVLLNWREPGFCEVHCSGGEEFQLCSNACEKSCRSLSLADDYCTSNCVEGCNCPDNFHLRSDGQCVEKSECPCYNLGLWFKPGKTYLHVGVMCQCINGILKCEGEGTVPTICPVGQVYRNCTANIIVLEWISGIECAKTCQNKELPCPKVSCESGCMCPNGLVLNEGKCIKPEQCPCYHNGKYHEDGTTLTVECNTCKCDAGHWDCTKKFCDGQCHVVGESNFLTFDIKQYDFKGDCEYTLTTDICNSNRTGTFLISFHSHPCETLGYTCSRTVFITLGSTTITLEAGKSPKIEHGVNSLQSGIPFQISKHGFFVFVTTGIGIRVLWDKATRIYVQLDSVYMGKVCGLCGNFDGDSNNDFSVPMKDMVTTSFDFGNSWRVKPSCPAAIMAVLGDMCDPYPTRRSWAERQCSILHSGTFQACHSEVDQRPYYSHCLSDTCGCEAGGDCECFCTAVAAYAHACSMKGVYIKWRSLKTCPTMCEQYNNNDTCVWKYDTCGTPCPNTCCHTNEPCLLPCVEGCFPHCPFDFVFDVAKQACVPISSCPYCPPATTTTTTTATTVFISTATTAAVSTTTTATVETTACLPCFDSDGKPREVGDMWVVNNCRKDVCVENEGQCPSVEVAFDKSTSCALVICPPFQMPEPKTYAPGELDPDECCDEYNCVCDNTQLVNCTEKVSEFSCPASSQKRLFVGVYPDTSGCCPDYECVCEDDAELAEICVDWNKNCQENEKKSVRMELCCPVVTCTCDNCVLYNGTEIEIGKRWWENECEEFVCLTKSGQLCPVTSVMSNKTDLCTTPNICSEYEEIFEITYADPSEDEDLCCPEFSCRCKPVDEINCPIDNVCSAYENSNHEYYDLSACCPKTLCECKDTSDLQEICSQWYDFTCPEGENRVDLGTQAGTNDCCPSYGCEKSPCLSPDGEPFTGSLQFPFGDKCCNWTCVFHEGVESKMESCENNTCNYFCGEKKRAVITSNTLSNPCCYEYYCECIEDACVDPVCEPNQKLEVDSIADGVVQCCNVSRCECIGCYFEGVLRQVDETWGNACTTFKCVDDESNGCYTVSNHTLDCGKELTCPAPEYERRLAPRSAEKCCKEYYCECVAVEFNGQWYKMGDVFPDPEHPACGDLVSVRKKAGKCPEIIKQPKECFNPTCNDCQERVSEGYDECCGDTYRCVTKTCPTSEICSPGEIQSRTTTQCCNYTECACSCTGIGSAYVKPFNCNESVYFETGECTIVGIKVHSSDDFVLNVDTEYCAYMYPHLNSTPVTCVKRMVLIYNGTTYEMDAQYNVIIVDDDLIDVGYIGDARITFAPDGSSTTMIVDGIGLHIIHHNRNFGEFDVYLKKSYATSAGTEGLCGNCSSSSDPVSNCSGDIISYTEEIDCQSNCTTIGCWESVCANSDSCNQSSCYNCSDFGYSNPCEVLRMPMFDDCFLNVDDEVESCTKGFCSRDQCSYCDSSSVKRSIDKCPPCRNYFKLLGCVNETTTHNTTCPENQNLEECIDSCEVAVSCDNLQEQSCGLTKVTSCVCPDGYVKKSATSEKCVKRECCQCNVTECPNMPSNYKPTVIDVDECGCNVTSNVCVCTDECINPNDASLVMQPGDVVVDSSNLCITHRCEERTSGECSVVNTEEKTCPLIQSCEDQRYVNIMDPATASNCCPSYNCECELVFFNGVSYEVGENFPDPEDPICSTMTVIRKSSDPNECPEIIRVPKTCPVTNCTSCEDRLLSYTELCCGDIYICEPKTCPESQPCLPNRIASVTTTTCGCEIKECACSCTNIGRPYMKPYHCNNSYHFEGGNCIYVVSKFTGYDLFLVAIEVSSCAQLYPQFAYPAVSCIDKLKLEYGGKEYKIHAQTDKVYENDSLVSSNLYSAVEITFTPTSETPSEIAMTVKDIGLHILYRTADQGSFNVYLKGSSLPTEGLCGNCSESTVTDCQVNPVDVSREAISDDCVPHCPPNQENCERHECSVAPECLLGTCTNCTTLGYTNPCLVLLSDLVSECFDNPEEEFRKCNASYCSAYEATAEEQCSTCNNLALSEFLDRCPSCLKIYEKLGCHNETNTENVTCPENQVLSDCTDSCVLKISCNNTSTEDCGLSVVTACRCPDGYVKESPTSDKCVKIECCSCPMPECPGMPSNYNPPVIDKDECGCDVYSNVCVCTENCVNPNNPKDVLQPGQTVIDSSSPCITHVCPLHPVGECNYVSSTAEICFADETCNDTRYVSYLNESTTNDCCWQYYCVCEYTEYQGEVYRVGDTMQDPTNPNCSEIVIDYPADNTSSCPVATTKTTPCGSPQCNACEEKVNVAYDKCCGEIYSCAPKPCPSTIECGPNQERTTTRVGCCDNVQCACKSTGIGATTTTTLDCRSEFSLRGNCSYLAVKDVRSDLYRIDVNVATCIDIYPTIYFGQEKTCVQSLTITFNSTQCKIVAKTGEVYINGIHLTSDLLQGSVSIVMQPTVICLTIREIGLTVYWMLNDKGVFTLILDTTFQNRQTEGLLGNCALSNYSTESCPVENVNISEYQNDLSCPTPCGKGDTCQEERCATLPSCFVRCKNCTDLEHDNPCLALHNPVFDDCLLEEDFDVLLESCLAQQCFKENVTTTSTIESECNVCTNSYISDKIKSCERDKGVCARYQTALNCETGMTNTTCPGNQVYQECRDTCKAQASCGGPDEQCGLTFITGCSCPDGYVKQNGSSDVCVQSKCCECPRYPCAGMPPNVQAEVTGTDECECPIYGPCACTPQCVNPETNVAIKPGETIILENPCVRYFCPEDDDSGDCGKIQVIDRSHECPTRASLGCGNQKVLQFNESVDACCPVSCGCPPSQNQTCPSQYHVVEETAGECPSQFCKCDCPDVPSACTSSPGCMLNITKYSEDECKCPTETECVPNDDVCTERPDCGKCLSPKRMGADPNSQCQTPCSIWQCTKVDCPVNPSQPTSCGTYERFESHYAEVDTDQCCPLTECNCLPQKELMHICPQWNFTCPENYTRSLVSAPIDCCPQYECECQHTNCPSPFVCTWGRLQVSLPKVTQGAHNEVCCNTTWCTCDNVACDPRPTECSPFHSVQTDNTTNPCCPIYNCQCDQSLYPSKTTNPVYMPDKSNNSCNNVPGQNSVPQLDASECFTTCECLPSDEAEEMCPDSIFAKWNCLSPKVVEEVEHPANDTLYTCCKKLICKCPDCGPGYKTREELEDTLRPDQKVVQTSSEECCANYTLVCKEQSELASYCSSYNATCTEGYKRVRNETDYGCCPAYHCACDTSMCPTVPKCEDPMIPIYYKTEGACCGVYECICPTDPNRSLTCDSPRILDTRSNTSCPSKYCRCPDENECPGESTSECFLLSGCRPVVIRRDDCGCIVESGCIGDPALCDPPPQCPTCFDAVITSSYETVKDCTTTCNQYECRRSACPEKPPLPSLCDWNEVSINFSSDGCCTTEAVVCKPQYCPPHSCGDGYHYENVPGEYVDEPNCSDLKCCPKQECVCDVCFYRGNVYNPGNSWHTVQDGECVKEVCSNVRQDDGCYSVITEAAQCLYNHSSINIVVSIDCFINHPEDSCKEMKCVWSLTDDNHCTPILQEEDKPCPPPQPCPSDKELSGTKSNPNDCCETYQCLCKPCGEGYQSKEDLIKTLRPDQKLMTASGQECCPTYTSICKDPEEIASFCSEYKSTCPPGYQREQNDTGVGCCDAFYCVCDACFYDGDIYSPGQSFYALKDGQCVAKICENTRKSDGCYALQQNTAECIYGSSHRISVGSYIEHPDNSCKFIKCEWSGAPVGSCSTYTTVKDKECPNAPTCPDTKELVGSKENVNDCCETYRCRCKSCGEDYVSRTELEETIGRDEMIIQNSFEECCVEFKVVCKQQIELASYCSRYNVTCTQGYKRVRNETDYGCCPAYHCACDTSMCPTVPNCEEPMIPIYYKTEGACCGVYECICPSDPNRHLTCESPYILDTRSNISCPSKYCRCPNEGECARESTSECSLLSGCRPGVLRRDECGCVVESGCIADPSPCDERPQCPTCFEVYIESTYKVVENCTTMCNQYECRRSPCPDKPPLPFLCDCNEVSTKLSSDGCCTTDTVVCKPQGCPPSSCDLGYHSENVPGEYADGPNCPDLKCCPKRKCVCDVCFYQGEMYNPGDSWYALKNGECVKEVCSTFRQDGGCYSVTVEAASCIYTSTTMNTTLSVNSFVDHPDDSCQYIECVWTGANANQCSPTLREEDKSCPTPSCSSDKELMIGNKINPTDCCETYQCVCKACGEGYQSKEELEKTMQPDQKLVVSSSQECCPNYTIICKDEHELADYCASYNMECSEGYSKLRNSSNVGCCPCFYCECQACLFVPVRIVHDCQVRVNLTLEENPAQECCPESKVICKPKETCCLNLTCGEDEYLLQNSTMHDANTGYCCPSQQCVCVDDCGPDYKSKEYLENQLKPGEVVMSETPEKKCCPKHTIFCKSNGELQTVCSAYNNYSCDEGYVREENGWIGCCDKYKCVCDSCQYNGVVRNLNDVWTDPNNPCSLLRCSSERQPDGCYSVTESLGGCYYDGKWYPIGSEIPTNDSCRHSECQEVTDLNGNCIHQFYERIITCGVPECGRYEIFNTTKLPGQCCPEVDCICGPCGDDYTGPSAERDPEPYEKVVPLSVWDNPNYVCCPRSKIVCQDYSVLLYTCPQINLTNADCGLWQQLERKNHITDCCPEYECACLTCPNYPPLRSLHACEEYVNLTVQDTVLQECCPRQKIQCKNEESCCPIPECGQYREAYDTGGRNSTNNCCPQYECRCRETDVLQQICPNANMSCPENYRKIPSNMHDACCPTFECQCYACTSNGIVFPIDAVWCDDTDHCMEVKCVDEGNECPEMVDRQKYDCEYINEEACIAAGGETLPNMTTEGCCPYCHQTGMCHVFDDVQDVSVTTGNGVTCSKSAVNIPKCNGTCETFSQYSMSTGNFQTNCNCCKPFTVENKTEQLQCADGATEPYSFSYTTSCKCQHSDCIP